MILEDYETDHKSLHLGRMDDAAKYEMFRRHREDPEGKWTVERLAATYGISQPRTQAILLLKTWEEAERAEGRVTEEDDAREAAVHEAHVAAVAKLLDQQQGGASSSSYSSSYSSGGRRGGRGADADADLNAAASASAVGRAGAYREDGAAAARGGPLGSSARCATTTRCRLPDPDALAMHGRFFTGARSSKRSRMRRTSAFLAPLDSSSKTPRSALSSETWWLVAGSDPKQPFTRRCVAAVLRQLGITALRHCDLAVSFLLWLWRSCDPLVWRRISEATRRRLTMANNLGIGRVYSRARFFFFVSGARLGGGNKDTPKTPPLTEGSL